MAVTHGANIPDSLESAAARRSGANRLILPGVGVIRQGRVEPFLLTPPKLSSTAVQWGGIALDNYSVPAVIIPRHEHPEDFLHLVLRGSAKYEVNTGGRTLRFAGGPGTLFILPRGTVDEITWKGPTRRIAAAINSRLLTKALDESTDETDIELTEHWNLTDRHISALLVEMTADLEDDSPAGQIYGESLANTLAVYLLRRYAVRRQTPTVYKGGLPRHRLKRVLDYIADNLAEDLSLSQLATVAGMSPHYFSVLFRQSMGRAPHSYVLLQRIKRAKQQLRDPERSVIQTGLEAGFQSPSHFARVFRKLVGASPSRFRADIWSGERHHGVVR
jgi:AraC family transcriptional regulator